MGEIPALQYGALGLLGLKMVFDAYRQREQDRSRREQEKDMNKILSNHLEHVTASYDKLEGAINKYSDVNNDLVAIVRACGSQPRRNG